MADDFITITDDDNPNLGQVVSPRAKELPDYASKEFPDELRFLVQNVFDTDNRKRRSFLKKHGWEMHPNDPNRVRPLGTTQPYDIEIDPGITNTFRKGGWKALADETIKDITQDPAVMYVKDLAIIKAGVKAKLAGTALGGPIVGISAGTVAGFGAALAVEGVKDTVANTLLDENIPPDYSAMVFTSLMDAAAPHIGKVITKGAGAALKLGVQASSQAVRGMARIAGNNLNAEILEQAAKNPEKFSPEAVKGATAEFDKVYRTFFGINAGEKIPNTPSFESEFGRKLRPVKAALDAEIENLSSKPEHNISVSEALGSLENSLKEVQKLGISPSTKDKVRDFILERKEEIIGIAKKNLKAQNPKAMAVTDDVVLNKGYLKFGQAVDLKRDVRQMALGSTDTENNLIRQAFGSGEGQFNSLIKSKASPLYNELAADVSKKLDVYKRAAKKLTPSNLITSFSGSLTASSPEILQLADEVDDAFQLGMVEAIRDGAMQSAVERALRNNAAKGSGGFWASAAKGAGALGSLGTAAGSLFGPLGAVIGGATLGTAGAVLGGRYTNQGAVIDDFMRIRALESLGKRVGDLAEQSPLRAQLIGRAAINTPAGLSSLRGRSDQPENLGISAEEVLQIQNRLQNQGVPQSATPIKDEDEWETITE